MYSARQRIWLTRPSLLVSDSPGLSSLHASTTALGSSSGAQPISSCRAQIPAMRISPLSIFSPTARLSAR